MKFIRSKLMMIVSIVLASAILATCLGASSCDHKGNANTNANSPASDQTWLIIEGALAGAPDLIASFGVSAGVAQELRADFDAFSAAATAVHNGQGVITAARAALDKLAADGSRLLAGAAANRIKAIVDFLSPFFPQALRGMRSVAPREPTQTEALRFKALMQPL
jgi:hypothetical protein